MNHPKFDFPPPKGMQQGRFLGARMLASASLRPVRAALLIATLLAGYYYLNPFSAHHSPPVDWRTAPASAVSTPTDGQDHLSNSSLILSAEGGPRIRQATMIYDTDKFNAIYERTLDSHIKHARQWGYPTHVLRHDIVDAGFFNKPAFLLGLIIEEMAKPYGQRADWIV